jgi:hypothetical protein
VIPAGTLPGVNFPTGPRLVIRQVDGTWKAHGYGEMRCVKQCAFFSNGGPADERWVSNDFEASTGQSSSIRFDEEGMWEADAMAVMSSVYKSGVAGLNGSTANPEYARVFQDGFTFVPERFGINSIQAQVNSGSPSSVAVFAYSFFVGRPHTDHQVNFQEFSLNGLGDIELIPDSQGICSFHEVKGVKLTSFPNIKRTTSGVWRLQILGTTNHASAKVFCYKFNQNQ